MSISQHNNSRSNKKIQQLQKTASPNIKSVLIDIYASEFRLVVLVKVYDRDPFQSVIIVVSVWFLKCFQVSLLLLLLLWCDKNASDATLLIINKLVVRIVFFFVLFDCCLAIVYPVALSHFAVCSHFYPLLICSFNSYCIWIRLLARAQPIFSRRTRTRMHTYSYHAMRDSQLE